MNGVRKNIFDQAAYLINKIDPICEDKNNDFEAQIQSPHLVCCRIIKIVIPAYSFIVFEYISRNNSQTRIWWTEINFIRLQQSQKMPVI